MKKRNQFVVASLIAVAGIVLMSINRFSASADSYILSDQKISLVVIVGLVLLATAALWFYRLSVKE